MDVIFNYSELIFLLVFNFNFITIWFSFAGKARLTTRILFVVKQVVQNLHLLETSAAPMVK